jgi:MFS family permease
MPIAIAMQRGRWRDSFSTLRIANYRKYAASQGISNVAGWAMRVATDWLVLELTGNIALVGLTIAIQFAPLLLFGAWGGVIADRFPRRAMLIATQSGASVISAVLAVLAITGVAQLWMIYLLVALLGVVQLLDGPSRSVLVSEIVGPRQLRNAISLNASIFHLGALIGPALSGIAIVAVGSGWSIAANAVAAAIGALFIAWIRQEDLLTAPRAPKAKGQIREAVRYVLAKPSMFWTFAIVTFVSVFGLPLPTLLAGMADTVFETGAQGYGLYNSLLAVGALTGALLSTRRTELRLRTIVLGAMLYGVLQTLVGLAPFYPMFLFLLVTVGFSRLLYATAAETMVQLSSNLRIRGRVMSFFMLILVGGQAIGGPIMGVIAEVFGSRAAVVVSGAVPALAAVAISIVLARTGQLRVRVTPRLRGSWITIAPRAAGADLE